MKRVSGSSILSGNYKAGDSVVHVIHSLILAGERSLFDTIKSYPELATFGKYLCKSCFESYIRDNGQVTVFAPTNEAFAALPNEIRENLSQNHVDLKNFLLQHIHKGLLFTTDLKPGVEYGVRPLKGKVIRLKKQSLVKIVLNGNSQVIIRNIRTSEGLIHIINKVILI